jgi:hypothetical protein
MTRTARFAAAWALVLVAAAAIVGSAGATRHSAPPVGALPAGPTSTIQTQKGELVAVALPNRGGGKVWRIARAFDAKVLQQVGEANVGGSVVLVFKAKGSGTTAVVFGLTKGETAKAYESRKFVVSVR